MNTQIDVAAITRASMLRMGKTWQDLGKLNQAMDTYFRIILEHPNSEEAQNAQIALLEITRGFEGEGCFHLAIDILDRLNEATA